MSNQTTQDILNMGMHTSMQVNSDNVYVYRVIGGWIYMFNNELGRVINQTFVPEPPVNFSAEISTIGEAQYTKTQGQAVSMGSDADKVSVLLQALGIKFSTYKQIGGISIELATPLVAEGSSTCFFNFDDKGTFMMVSIL